MQPQKNNFNVQKFKLFTTELDLILMIMVS